VKNRIQRALRAIGYEIRSYKRPGGGAYGPVRPYATYTPWDVDREFLDTYRKIQAHTLVDKYRCFELWSLVDQSRKGEGALVEVGVWRGGTGALIARRAMLSGIADRVYLCDTFSGVVKASDKDSSYSGGEHSDTDRGTVERLLASLGLSNAVCLTGVFPEQTAHLIHDSKIRFCHVDVDVYESAKDVVEWVWPRLCVGGVVVFDDYGFPSCSGITRYVEELTRLPDRAVLHNLNGHAVAVKTGR